MPSSLYAPSTADFATNIWKMLAAPTLAAAPALETAVTSRQSVSVPPPYQQDEAAIARGHAERRLLLAQRRAEQQLTVIMAEASRLGVTLSVETLARTAIAAYVDTMKVARR